MKYMFRNGFSYLHLLITLGSCTVNVPLHIQSSSALIYASINVKPEGGGGGGKGGDPGHMCGI